MIPCQGLQGGSLSCLVLPVVLHGKQGVPSCHEAQSFPVPTALLHSLLSPLWGSSSPSPSGKIGEPLGSRLSRAVRGPSLCTRARPVPVVRISPLPMSTVLHLMVVSKPRARGTWFSCPPGEADSAPSLRGRQGFQRDIGGERGAIADTPPLKSDPSIKYP